MNTGSLALDVLRNRLHISNSQLNLYLTCSLKYYFRYVRRLPAEHRSINLIFGKAIHVALEAYYLAYQKTGRGESLEYLADLFEMYILSELVTDKHPKVLFDKTIPDFDMALCMGKGILKAFVESENLDGYKVIAVELPLSVPLDSHPDCELLGVIDLLLLDADGNLVVVDHKTAKNSIAQNSADQDLQMTVYSHLLRETGYADYEQPLKCQFNALRKLKKPKIEKVETIRCQEDNRRMLKLFAEVLYGIEQRVYMPCKSWMCANCEYPTACRAW